MDMAHLFTEDGRKSVAGREVKIFTPEGVQVINPATEAIYHDLLKIHFGIVI
jgi:N-hydroxyarylamine O-acetyltransferase